VHFLTQIVLYIYFNIILTCKTHLPSGHFLVGFPNKILYSFVSVI